MVGELLKKPVIRLAPTCLLFARAWAISSGTAIRSFATAKADIQAQTRGVPHA